MLCPGLWEHALLSVPSHHQAPASCAPGSWEGLGATSYSYTPSHCHTHRDSASPSKEDLATAVNLLLAAAGIDAIQVAPGRGRAAGTGTPHARDAPVTAADVSIVPTPDAGPPHKEALRELIYVYLEGDGVPYNPAIADALLHVLADAGSAEAGADVGLHTALGVRLVGPNPRGALFALSEPDLPAALARYQLAAMAGDGAAQMALGHRHLHGLGVPRSCEAAALYYIPAAGAAVALALARGGDDDMVRAVGYLRQSAEAGDAEAQAHLGHAYAGGVGVARDNATAAHWFKQAAEKGGWPGGGFLGSCVLIRFLWCVGVVGAGGRRLGARKERLMWEWVCHREWSLPESHRGRHSLLRRNVPLKGSALDWRCMFTTTTTTRWVANLSKHSPAKKQVIRAGTLVWGICTSRDQWRARPCKGPFPTSGRRLTRE